MACVWQSSFLWLAGSLAISSVAPVLGNDINTYTHVPSSEAIKSLAVNRYSISSGARAWIILRESNRTGTVWPITDPGLMYLPINPTTDGNH